MEPLTSSIEADDAVVDVVVGDTEDVLYLMITIPEPPLPPAAMFASPPPPPPPPVPFIPG